MNIFNEYLGFTGNVKFSTVSNFSFRRVMELSRNIRNQLGKKSYLLDKYLSNVFKGIAAVSATNAVEIGSETESELRAIVYSILNHDGKKTDHPFYKTAFDFIAEHPLDYQDHSIISELYIIALYDEFFEFKLEGLIFEVKEEARAAVDIVQINNLYKEICDYLYTENLMEELNFILKQRFLFAYPMQVVSQGMADGFINSLITTDEESGKLLLRLVLDDSENFR